MSERWQNQEEAFQFAMVHSECMLDMEMGTGKTRVAIDVVFARPTVKKVLVVCPKAVLSVWPRELKKHASGKIYKVYARNPKTKIADAAQEVRDYLSGSLPGGKKFVVMNYDAVWRWPMGDVLLRADFDMVILDESHRAKAAGSKTSKYLAMLGKRVNYKMCLSGTPMANSPLDVYGQYRFLDPSIFGTNYNRFLQEYAIMGGPERRFVVGYKNQQDLKARFQSIAYTCKMADVADRIKLPDHLPPVQHMVSLPARDMNTSRKLGKEMLAECGTDGIVTASNVLVKVLRLQQIAAGFCEVQDGPLQPSRIQELNFTKQDALADLLLDISESDPVVVFCVFKHDLDAVAVAAHKAGRIPYELSGRINELERWQHSGGAILAVQIQAGAEGVDMTRANHAIYFSLPHSLALYDQSRARLYRPGQTRPVSFIHLIAEGTIDESMYGSLVKKKDVIESIKDGTFDFGFIK